MAQRTFREDPTSAIVPALLICVAILEVTAGTLGAIGCVFVILRAIHRFVLLRGDFRVAVLALFFGQRVAKDYAGAAVLVPYFLLMLVAMYLLAQQ